VLAVLLQGTEQLALLLSSAAASLQQPVAGGTLPGQQRHLVLNFCLAIKVRITMQYRQARPYIQCRMNNVVHLC
jgi:hypothetical protein